MSLFIASLNSGSNGNCYYIGNEHDAVLVDAGISCRETEKRMLRLGLSMNKVRAIFISHEHSDHINGVAVLAKKYQIRVYITPKTMQRGGLIISEHLVLPFMGYIPERVGEMEITAFPKFHDASDPHSFIISYNNINVGVFTDIGAPCEHVIKHFSICHAAFLEANYDETMLEQGRYPYHLKRRIRSGHGHLSNTQALDIFKTHKPAYMSHLLLAHLSKDNNDVELVHNLFNTHANGTHVVVATRFAESEVYHVGSNPMVTQPAFEREVGQFTLF
jgi:phosphoribosyl 1,2-cyclic phosphodiesterase